MWKYLLPLLLIGCATQSTPSVPILGYHLQPNDTIQLRVYEEPEVSGTFKLDGKGNIRVPLAGSIAIGHHTEEQAAEIVESTLVRQGLIRSPKVSMEVIEARPFYVLGEVEKAGQFPFQPGMTVYQAIATAGGFTYRADKDDITLRRFDRTDIQASMKTEIMPGDTIDIGERFF